MNVNFSSQIGAVNFDSKRAKSLKSEQNKNGSSNITNLKNMPNYKYMVSFGAKNDNLESLFNSYGNNNGMPITYDKATQKLTKEEREKITDVYANYKSVYADMENCHTVEELKEKYPLEFKNLTSALTRKDSKGSFLTQLNRWAKVMPDFNEYLFPETKDNDFSVYLAKKIYFEAKTKKEIQEDFKKDINPNLLNEIKTLGADRKKVDDDKIIPDSVYSQLGLIGDLKSNGFRHSLSCSREAYIEKYGSIYKERRLETFNKIVDEVIGIEKTEKTSAPQKNTARYEKSQFSMYHVWNNSMDIRRAMSEFLIKNHAGNELLKPDFMEITLATKSNVQQQNQKSLMYRFWAENPELRADFKQRCINSYAVVEKSIDNGTFEELKKDILTTREQIYEQLKTEKEAKEAEIAEQKRLQELEQQRLAEIEKLNSQRKLFNAEIMNKVFDVVPVPKSEQRKFMQYINELTKNSNNGDENFLIIQAHLEALTDKSMEPVKKVFRICTDSIQKPLLKTVVEELIKDPYLRNNPRNILEEKAIQQFDYGTTVFKSLILMPYLCELIKLPSPEISKQERKDILNKIYQKATDNNFYKEKITSNGSSKIVEKLVRHFAINVTPKDLLSAYKKAYCEAQ